MIKKRKSKKRVSGGSRGPAKPPNEEARPRDEEHSTYGGLPNRDLKKNLGCG